MYGLRVPDLYFNNVNKKFCTAWILSPYEHFRVVILGKKTDFYVALGVKYIEFHMGVKLEKTGVLAKKSNSVVRFKISHSEFAY